MTSEVDECLEPHDCSATLPVQKMNKIVAATESQGLKLRLQTLLSVASRNMFDQHRSIWLGISSRQGNIPLLCCHTTKFFGGGWQWRLGVKTCSKSRGEPLSKVDQCFPLHWLAKLHEITAGDRGRQSRLGVKICKSRREPLPKVHECFHLLWLATLYEMTPGGRGRKLRLGVNIGESRLEPLPKVDQCSPLL